MEQFSSKYLRLQDELERLGQGNMKVFGFSMLPKIRSGALCAYRKQDKYAVGDIVFCKVRGRFIDAHLVVKVSATQGYLIANNAGHENGWTKQVYGRVVAATYTHGKTDTF